MTPLPAAGFPDLGALLRREVARVAQVPAETISGEQSLLALGLDSLAVIELLYGLEQALGVAIPPAEILEGIDLAGLETLVSALLPGAARQEASAAALAAAASPIAAAAEEVPLSPGQLALWLVQEVAAHSGPLHIAAAAHVLPASGRRLDTAALGRCLAALAERHPVLLSTFAERDGEPRQRFGAGLPPELVEVDAADWPEQELDAWCERQAWRPFDLAAGPLVRVAVARRGGGDAIVFTIHHLVADFWSVAVLVRDLSALYLGEPLPRLPMAYADHLRRQAERLASPEAERLWTYWREQLTPPPPSLALPGDRPRPAVRSYRGGAVQLDLGPEVAAGLRAVARRSGTTLFTVLLAGFQAFLGRISGERDLVAGSPAAGRDRPELAGLAGYFVNMMPLRADLAGDPA
ncbi:MAG TPA: condensation domain-containing protein, partial [Thermoanaerobaculia bacterium]|nr:condensation domain-containing protein [Thermoanaerobaculia bacterium]